MNVRNHQKYRDSGEGWLREIPEHWNTFASRRIFAQTRETVHDGDEQLSATQTYGMIPQRIFMEREGRKVVLALTGTGNFKHVKAGDFVISLRSFEGGIEYTAYDGCVSPAYTTLRAIMPINDRYWLFLLKSPAYIGAIQSVTQGIRDGKSIDYGQFGALLMPFPPLSEQHAIADFLDRETAKIDDLIAEQERLIALINEKRQAVISHAVTKGLDSSVPMKDSGVEWIGEIPADWNMTPIKVVTTCNDEVLPENTSGDQIIDYVEIGDVDATNGVRSSALMSFGSAPSRARRRVKHGDVIVSTVRTYLRAIAPIRKPKEFLIVSTGFAVFRPKNIHSGFLSYLLLAEFLIAQIIANSVGVSYPSINPSEIGSMKIPVPHISDQQAIVEYLDSETIKLDALKAETEEVINLLKERRSALISAAVTGKIDVRSLTPTEPEITA